MLMITVLACSNQWNVTTMLPYSNTKHSYFGYIGSFLEVGKVAITILWQTIHLLPQ